MLDERSLQRLTGPGSQLLRLRCHHGIDYAAVQVHLVPSRHRGLDQLADYLDRAAAYRAIGIAAARADDLQAARQVDRERMQILQRERGQHRDGVFRALPGTVLGALPRTRR